MRQMDKLPSYTNKEKIKMAIPVLQKIFYDKDTPELMKGELTKTQDFLDFLEIVSK